MIYDKAMKQVGTRISVPTWEKLISFCKKHNMTQSEFIRFAIEQILERY